MTAILWAAHLIGVGFVIGRMPAPAIGDKVIRLLVSVSWEIWLPAYLAWPYIEAMLAADQP